MNGLLIVNKPVGPTSHDIVYRIRKWSGERRVGHTGTLDPLASGVLVICLGTATRISEYVLHSDKRYTAVIRLGQTTATYDSQGRVVDQRPVDLTQDQIEPALAAFRGEITQTPPAYSAVQVGGRRAYDMARQGEEVDLKPRTVTIHSLNLLAWKSPDLTLDIFCSAGTYIRTIAHDLGQALGCGGHVTGLTRTATGPFKIEDAVPLGELQNLKPLGFLKLLKPTDHALLEWPEVKLDAEGANRIQHGNPVPLTPGATGLGRAYDPRGRLVALVEADPANNEWKPKKVLITA
ncbi:MAG TPA: tRNA pseudouridine(55) synthase TruB [Anaerolineales bacterium]|nr:tRNA pseudouridine(55) synthase TruB [Anaerolineales bacterium]